MDGKENNALIILFIHLLTISHVSLLLNSATAINPNGFSMKIIHRDSKESPLYPGDHLTQEERLERLVQQSKYRAHYIGSKISSFNKTTNSINPDVARLSVSYELAGVSYVALVGIGTFNNLPQTFKNYYLVVDSGSQLIWTQCEGASSSFHQDEPLYPAKESSTFEPLHCDTETNDGHPLCYPGRCNDQGICTYDLEYGDTSHTSGILAKEKFTVNSDNDALQSFDLIMGCGLKQEEFEPSFGYGYDSGKPDIIAGILGMSGGPRSFLSQLGPDVEGKFAYCLQPYTDGTSSSTYLRFGLDATIGGQGQQVYTTPLFFHPVNPYHYYVNLEDISVNGNRIGFEITDFEYKEDTGRGGFLFDTGTPVTVINGAQYDIVAERVIAYFQELDIHPIAGEPREYFDLCFAKPNKDFKYPTITFHFQQADFVLDKQDTAFSITDNDFCFGLLRFDSATDVIFGAMQQAHKRILHDVMGGSLSFAAEECQLGS